MRVIIVGVNKFKSKKGNDLCQLHYVADVSRPGFTGRQAASSFVDNKLAFGIENFINTACDIYSSPGNSFIDVLIPVESGEDK